MKQGYFDWLETMETYEAIMYLSKWHPAYIADIRK